jgi:hypothetical protein
VARYANTTVAHVERDPDDARVTYADFHRALEHLGDPASSLLPLDQPGRPGLDNTRDSGDWKGPFRKPLV